MTPVVMLISDDIKIYLAVRMNGLEKAKNLGNMIKIEMKLRKEIT